MVKKILIALGLFIVGVNVYIVTTSSYYIYYALYYQFADIDDYKLFPNRTISPSENPQEWELSKNYNKKNLPKETLEMLEELNSVAFLVIQNDSLLFEKYWDGYSENSLSGSFSVAKSFVSALTGIALKEGKIRSLDQPVAEFLPEFNSGEKKKITIRHLLTMSSGLNWDEGYASPISITTEAYYGDDLERTIKKLQVVKKPGVFFNYKSGDTQILAMVLEKATGVRLSKYMEEKLWKPLGARNPALWSLDRDNGLEKAYCCINSNARDFARLGKLYLNKGIWDGKEILPEEYIRQSIMPNNLIEEVNPDAKVNFYGYSWWLIPEYKKQFVYYARGIQGQYVMVLPEKNVIVVRLGKDRLPTEDHHFGDVYKILDGVNQLLAE